MKDLVSHIQEEDRGVDRVVVYSMDGKRIASATPIDMLIQQNFKIKINDKSFDIITPKPGRFFVWLLLFLTEILFSKNLILLPRPVPIIWPTNYFLIHWL